MTGEQFILVTGASGGIGAAVVGALLRRRGEHGGARIVATDLPGADSTADADIHEAEADGILLRRSMDVTDRDAVDDLFAELSRRATLRAVIHVAGLLRAGSAWDAAEDDLRAVFDVNALGTIRVLAASAQAMRAQDASLPPGVRSLTTVASNAGTGPRAGLAVYGASKAAASSFTRSLGLELGPSGVRCNVVSPGTTRTAMVDELWAGTDRTAATIAGEPALFRAGVPLGRIADPADIADAVEFLASERARHITLTDLTVDGGATQR